MDVAFNVTRRCNKTCDYCYLYLSDSDLPFSTFKEILEKLEIRNLTLTGGEALLHQDIFRMIKLANTRVEKVDLLTNGLLLTSVNLKRLSELGPTIYATYNQPDSTLLKRLKRTSKKLEVNIYHLLREGSLDYLQSLCERLEFAEKILLLYPTNMGKGKVSMYTPRKWRSILRNAIEITKGQKFEVYYEPAFIKKISITSDTVICPTGEDIFIDVDGLNYPCCLLVDQVDGKEQLAPIKMDQYSCPFLLTNKTEETSEYMRICPLLLTSPQEKNYVFPSHLGD